MTKVSTCCGAEITDPLMEDYSICPECQEHCEFEDLEPNDDQIYNNFNHEGGIKFTITNQKP